MTGRESKFDNDVFFVCSLIEHIARQTKNHRSVVVNAIGKEKMARILELADVYHSDNMDRVSDDLIHSCQIKTGYYDNIALSSYSIPTVWDIGKVYKRLILNVLQYKKSDDVIDVLFEVYNSWISRKIEDLNSSLYYENPDYIFQSYLVGDVLI